MPLTAVTDPQGADPNIPVPLGDLVHKDSGFKGPKSLTVPGPKEKLHHGPLAPGVIVGGNAPQYPGKHPVHILCVLRIKAGTSQPLGCETADSFRNFSVGVPVNFREGDQLPVKGGRSGFLQERFRKIVVQHVVRHPRVQIPLHRVIQRYIFRPEPPKLFVALRRVFHACLIQNFINVKKGEGRGGFLQIAFPQLSAPGEVAPQFRIRQGLIGGVIPGGGVAAGTVVLVVHKKLCLLQKDQLPALPGVQALLLQRPGGFQKGRKDGGLRLGRLPLPDSLIHIDPGLTQIRRHIGVVKPQRRILIPVFRHKITPRSFAQMFTNIIHHPISPVKQF